MRVQVALPASVLPDLKVWDLERLRGTLLITTELRRKAVQIHLTPYARGGTIEASDMLHSGFPASEMVQRHDSRSSSAVTLRATVRGQVQGVFFRAFVRDAARRSGLSGYVRNQPDGSVYVVARGERVALQDLLALLRRGPDTARVEHVEAEWIEGANDVQAGSFEVRH